MQALVSVFYSERYLPREKNFSSFSKQKLLKKREPNTRETR